MAVIILLLLVGNVYQFKRNMDLSDNDLKYRLIKMYGGVSGNELDTLEVVCSTVTGTKPSSETFVMK